MGNRAGTLQVIGFLALAPLQAGLAQAPADDAVELETVIVTATRRTAERQDVAGAVDRVNEQEIARQAPDVVAAALRGLPGVFFQQTTPGQGIPIVRGLKGSQVLHLVDGVRLNNAFFRDAPNQYLGLVDALTVSRVEVLRGAAGGLYGADAMGGVVQMFTRETQFDTDRATSRYRLYGSFDTVDRGRLARAEAATGNRHGSLAGGFSWQALGDRRTGSGETPHPSGFRSRAGDLKLLLGDPASGAWMVAAQSLEQPATPRVDELVPGYGQSEASSAIYRFEPNRRDLLHVRYRRGDARRGLGALDVHLARQVITDDRSTQDLGSPVINTEQNESTLDGLVLQVIRSLSPDLTLTWGAELYRDAVRSARQERLAEGGAPVDVRGRFPDRSRLDSDAVYLDADWRIDERWRLDTALRYSRFDIRLPETTANPAVRLTPDDLTGDLRLHLALSPTAALAANLSRGFRPPNVFDLGTLGARPGNRFNVANPELGPETVWSYDLGLKLRGRQWTLEAYAFALDYRDRITSVATGDVTPDGRVVVRSENLTHVVISGIELGGTAKLAAGLEASLGVSYARGEERRDALPDTPADRIPPLNGRLGLTWHATERWRVEPWLLFAGRQDRLSLRDREDPRIDPGGTAGWWTANLDLAWRVRPGLDVGLRLHNLLDQPYREHGSGLDAAGFNLGLWLDASF